MGSISANSRGLPDDGPRTARMLGGELAGRCGKPARGKLDEVSSIGREVVETRRMTAERSLRGRKERNSKGLRRGDLPGPGKRAGRGGGKRLFTRLLMDRGFFYREVAKCGSSYPPHTTQIGSERAF